MHFNIPFIFNILLGPVVLALDSYNMTGAVLGWSDNNYERFNYIGGTFKVPSVFDDRNSNSAILVAVGIGLGDGCSDQILTALHLHAGGQTIPQYGWSSLAQFSDISISPGETIRLEVLLSSSESSAIFTIQNLSNQQHISETVTSPHPACMKNAGWIVARLPDAALASFTTVNITEPVASGLKAQYSPLEAQKVRMYEYSHLGIQAINAHVSSMDANTVTIQYGQ